MAAGRRSCPVGIIILALLQIINGVQLLLSGSWFLAISSAADTPEVRDALADSPPWLVDNLAEIFFWLGLTYIFVAILAFLFARGYVKGYEWARHKGRVLAVFLTLYGIFGLLILPPRADPASPFWTVVFNIAVFVYLGRPSVKSYFR